MATVTESAKMLAFVQRSQVVVGRWVIDDNVSNVAAVWSCLKSRPDCHTFADRLALTGAIGRLAWGLDHRLRLWSLTASYDVGLKKIPRRHRVEQLLQLIWSKRCESRLTLKALAEHMRMSEPYLSRALATVTGHGFAVHLNGSRIVDAAILLRGRDLSIKEIAARTGFSSTGELDRHSRLWFGMTPKEFRGVVFTGERVTDGEVRKRIAEFLKNRPTSEPSEIADTLGVDFGLTVHVLKVLHKEPLQRR